MKPDSGFSVNSIRHLAKDAATAMRNLIVAYDLMTPGQNYDAVRAAIRSLGLWYQFQYSLFFVQAELTPKEAYDRIRLFMDANDKLVVAEATEAFIGNYPWNDIVALQGAWLAA